MLRSVFTMSFATGVSRITGFLRTSVQAAVLGSGVVANSYTFSNVLPNQIYELFLGGLLSAIFIPLLIDRMNQHGDEDARALTNALLTIIVPVLSVIAILGIIFAEPLITLTTNWSSSSDFSREQAEETAALAIFMFRIFAFKILFYGVGAIAIGVLNSHRKFFLATFAPVLNNLIVIASFVAYFYLNETSPIGAIYVLAGGTTLGVAVMSLVLLPSMFRLGYFPRPRLGHPALLPAARLAGPMLLFVASSVGVQVFAYYLGSEYSGVADLLYAFTIFQLPYGVFVVAIATALMPDLSERFSDGDTDGYRRDLSFGLRLMAFIVVPASVGMIALANPIVGLLYERGRFDAADTTIVSSLLAAYGVGLLGYAAYFVLVRSFYARQNTRTPAILNVGLLVVYVALAYILSRVLELPGVAIAFSIAYFALAVGLILAMRRELGHLDGRRLAASLTKIVASGVAMFAAAEAVLYVTGFGTNALERLIILVLVGGASVVVYLAVAFVLRTEELRSAIAFVRRRSVRDARD